MRPNGNINTKWATVPFVWEKVIFYTEVKPFY